MSSTADARPQIVPDPDSDAALATRLAVEAGQLLVKVRDDLERQGAYPWQIMDTGDITSHQFLLGEFAAARPDDVVLSEEGDDDRRRYTAERVWIVDPLDGTNEYGEPGRSDWAVHIALWERGDLVAAAVSLPMLGLVFATEPAPLLPPIERARPRLVTSRTRNPYSAVVVANALGADAVRLGSAGAKAMAVVIGEADIYVHDGGMYQWDSAAPAAVAAAAGLHVSRIDGSPMVYNRRDTWLPDFLVCRQEYAADVLAALRRG
ncbi:MAG: 3'(2'),5'-bisphosphate nucleotidase CysQ [Ilumatobacteraceae bacterium]